MPYRCKETVTAANAAGEPQTYYEGEILSDFELSDFIRERIKEGHPHQRRLFEVLTDREAHDARVQATEDAGVRNDAEGEIKPPYDDYVGLSPDEIIARMSEGSVEEVAQVKRFEAAGLNRQQIIDYIAPVEHEPWDGYDTASTRDITEKMDVISDPERREVIAYEKAHKGRAAIVEFEPPPSQPASHEAGGQREGAPA